MNILVDSWFEQCFGKYCMSIKFSKLPISRYDHIHITIRKTTLLFVVTMQKMNIQHYCAIRLLDLNISITLSNMRLFWPVFSHLRKKQLMLSVCRKIRSEKPRIPAYSGQCITQLLTLQQTFTVSKSTIET